MNKSEVVCNKKREDSAEAELDPRTDNQHFIPFDNSPTINNINKSTLTVLILNCQSLVAKKASFVNLTLQTLLLVQNLGLNHLYI